MSFIFAHTGPLTINNKVANWEGRGEMDGRMEGGREGRMEGERVRQLLFVPWHVSGSMWSEVPRAQKRSPTARTGVPYCQLLARKDNSQTKSLLVDNAICQDNGGGKRPRRQT